MSPESKNKVELAIWVVAWFTACTEAGTDYFTPHWWFFFVAAWFIAMFCIIPCWRKL